MGFLTRLIAGFVAASTLGAGLAGTANAVDAAGAASDTTGAVATTADDTGGRTVLDCRQSGEGATGPYADNFCWIDWSNLPLSRTGEPTPVRINVPGGHIDADATITHTDNAALTAKDYTGSKWSRLTSAYKLTGNTALAFSGRMGRQDPAASVTFSNVTPSADRTDTGVNVLKDFQLAFGDAEVMSGGVLQGHDVYERTDIESDKTLEKLGMIGSGDPNQSYSKANTGYGTTHVTLAGGPKGATDDANKDSKGAAVVGAKQASRFKVSFGQVNQHWDGWGSAIAVGVYMPYLTAYPLTYDKNSSDASGQVPSNQRGKENTTQPAKTKTSGTVKTVADTNASLPDHLVNGDFEYPGANVLNNKGDWWGVSRKDRMVFAPQPRWVSLPSTFDSDRFAWDSTEVARVQNESSQWHTNEVELQRDSRTGNMYAELCAYQAHTSIHQYIHTTPGTLYKVRLKHASLSRDYLDKMQVLIGPDGNEQPVRMTRVESQNGLDATGKATASTTVSTHASNEMEIKDGQGEPYSSRNHDGQWATYEGVYVATSDVTSFTFKSVDSKRYNLGNLLDDIVFDKAYRLSYDKNATDANGSVPSDETAGATKQAKAGTTGALRLASDDDVATYAASNLPKQLVNSDFDHDWRNIVSQSKMSAKYNFANIDPAHGDVEISGALNSKGEDATGSIPSDTAANTTQPAKSETDGKVSDLVQRTTTHEDGSVTVKTIDTSTDVVSGCQVYYPAGQRITLATMAKDDDCWDSSMLSRPGHTQLGWNQDRNATQAQAQVTMVEGGMTVYAVWVGNPVLTYDTNKPSTWGGQMPSTPASVSVLYNTAAADKSGWAAGDTSKIRGYKFLGWYTGPQDNAGLYDWATPLTGNVTVYAHWQRLQANVVYDKNASDAKGSHANTTGWQYSDVTVPSDTSKSFTREGYYFKYWNTQKDGKGTTYKDGGQVPLQDKDVTLYAIWLPYHENFVETGGVSLPVLIVGGVVLLAAGVASTIVLTRRMRGEQ